VVYKFILNFCLKVCNDIDLYMYNTMICNSDIIILYVVLYTRIYEIYLCTVNGATLLEMFQKLFHPSGNMLDGVFANP
jgi:hypothetical protein